MSADALEPAAPEAPPRELRRLDTPSDGVPPVVTSPEGLAEVVAALAAGTGPVAVDAERASGHRYGQRAFLVQLRREGAGTALIDPAALPDLSALGAALEDAEWVLHAASQDLPCLAEVGLRPRTLFDTELGSRLAGLQRVGLAAVVEEFLGLGLAKEHSAVDWSTRPRRTCPASRTSACGPAGSSTPNSARGSRACSGSASPPSSRSCSG